MASWKESFIRTAGRRAALATGPGVPLRPALPSPADLPEAVLSLLNASAISL